MSPLLLNHELLSSPQALLSLFLLLPLFFFFFLPTIKRSFSSHKPKHPLLPSPPKLPLLGNLHQVGPLPHVSFHSLASTYGPVMSVRLGQVPTVVITSADVAAEVFKTLDVIFASRPPFKITGIVTYNFMDLAFTSYSKYWRALRRICTQNLLNPKRVMSLNTMREEEVGFMAEKIGAASSQSSSPVNLSEILFDYANDVICRVVSGKFSRRNELFRVLVAENGTFLGKSTLGDIYPKLGWLDGAFGAVKKAKRHMKRWDDVLSNVIKEHKEERKGGEEEDFTDVLLSLLGNSDFGFELKETNIKALMEDMFSAGSDTTATILEWAMAELIRNSKAMNKLVAEVRGIVGQNPKVKTEDLNKMSYMKAVVKETFRLHPPSPLIPRETTEDCNLRGYHIPKGTRVFISAWSVGRDPSFWESPNEFIPERFISNQVDFISSDCHLIPFGGGRRGCPGMQFALYTIEIGLTTLIHKFDWELPNGMASEDLDMEEGLGLTAPRKNRLKLILKPRAFSKE